MIQALTLLMIVVVTTFEFFQKGDFWGRWAVLPSGSQYVAEILSGVVLVVVVVAGTRNRFQFVRAAYWAIFGALLAVVACGLLANRVDPGPIFAGIRAYLRALPWFFLPAVYAFSDQQLRVQLRLLLAIAILQVPFAVEQASYSATYRLGFTGDWTVGTLLLSPTLSIFVISAACFVVAFVARRQVRLWQAIPLLALLLYPSMINETKASFALIPLGMVTSFIVATHRDRRFRSLLMALALAGLSLTGYLSVYDRMQKDAGYSVRLWEFITTPEVVKGYLVYEEDLLATGQMGKGDAMLGSLRLVSSDPTSLAFGLGIGNVSHSALGEGFTGRYFDVYGLLASTSFGRIVVEVGVLGLVLVLVLLSVIYLDSLAVARRDDGLRGTVAAAMAGITGIFVISIPYTELIPMTSLSYLFWYFAGLVASDRMRIQGRQADSAIRSL